MDLHAEARAYNSLALQFESKYEKLKALLAARGSWQAAFQKSGCQRDAEKDWAELQKRNIQLVLRSDPAFPKLLREIPWQPFALYWRGAPITEETKIAIVGTRKGTPQGLEAARTFSYTCAAAGVTVVSGLALGIDAASHAGALKAGGKTIAVLANGLNTVYPRQNERLAAEIIEKGGTLISEYPLGTPSLPRLFIERNRIVSGLSQGIVIIEAPKRSGTLATARFAIEQDRDVFVLPGGVKNPNYEGSLGLLKSGATLVTEPADVLQHLGIEMERLGPPKAGKLAKNEQLVLNVLTSLSAPTDADTIALQTKLPTRAVSESLAVLIIEGIIKEAQGKYFIA